MNTVTSLLDHLCEGDIVDAADLARVSDTHPRSVARGDYRRVTDLLLALAEGVAA